MTPIVFFPSETDMAMIDSKGGVDVRLNMGLRINILHIVLCTV